MTPHAPLILSTAPNRDLPAWLFGVLRNCTPMRRAINKARMVRLAEYSRDCLRDRSASFGLRCDGRARGALQLFRTGAFVIALGSYSAPLLRRFGLHIPVQPVKGYSLTARIADPDRAPVSTVLDETYKVAISAWATGSASAASRNWAVRPQPAVRPPQHPGALRRHAVRRRGRPRQGRLLVRPAAYEPGRRAADRADGRQGLYLNTGHGTLGWTMACGSARVLAHLLSGRTPDVDSHDLSIDRYANPA